MDYKKFTSADKKAYYREMEEIVEEYNSNGKKTVVLATDNFYPIVDGVLKVVESYAIHMKDRVNILVCAPTHRWKVPVIDDYPVLFCDSIYCHPLRYDYSLAASDSKFKKILDTLKIDLIHIHSPYFTGRFMINYANKRSIPVISTFHTQYRRDIKRVMKSDSVSDKVLDVLMKVFHMSDKVLVLNTACLKTLQSYGFDGDTQILHNGTDMTFDGNKAQLDALAEQTYNLSPDDTVLLFVGRLIKPKNIYLILDALEILHRRGESFKMLYVGDGDEKTRLKSKIKSLGMEDKVIMTGKILDRTLLKSLYCRANLFVFPSVYDSDSVVKYEAAAFSTPSLLLEGSNDACGIENNKTGFLCGDDPQKMADKIYDLIHDGDLLAKVGSQANRDLYNPWDEIVDRAYDIYMDVINKNDKNPICKGKKSMDDALKYTYKNVRKTRRQVHKKTKRYRLAKKKVQKRQNKKR